MNGQGTDRLGMIIKDWSEFSAAAGRFPNPATRGSYKNHFGVIFVGVNGSYAATGGGGTNMARPKSAEKGTTRLGK